MSQTYPVPCVSHIFLVFFCPYVLPHKAPTPHSGQYSFPELPREKPLLIDCPRISSEKSPPKYLLFMRYKAGNNMHIFYTSKGE